MHALRRPSDAALPTRRWDGLVRLVFNRKNKTLRASLTTRTVLDLLDRNYRTLASLAGEVRSGGGGGRHVSRAPGRSRPLLGLAAAGGACGLLCSGDRRARAGGDGQRGQAGHAHEHRRPARAAGGDELGGHTLHGLEKQSSPRLLRDPCRVRAPPPLSKPPILSRSPSNSRVPQTPHARRLRPPLSFSNHPLLYPRTRLSIESVRCLGLSEKALRATTQTASRTRMTRRSATRRRSTGCACTAAASPSGEPTLVLTGPG